MRKNIVKIVFVLLCTVLLVLIKSNRAFCDEQTDIKGNLLIEYIFEDVDFKIYKVADIHSENDYELCQAFANCQIDISSGISSDRKEQAEALAVYVEANDISALNIKSTNEYGVVNFNNIERGVYLILGNSIDSEGYTYIPLPILLNVPDNSVLGEEIYDIIIEPKYNKEQIIIPEEPEEPESSTEEESTPKPSDKPKPNIPQTGQKIGHIIACGYMAVTLFIASLFFRKKKNILYVTSIGGVVAMCLGIIFIAGNIIEDAEAKSQSKNIVTEMKEKIVSLDNADSDTSLDISNGADNVESDKNDMDLISIDGKEYIGIINIPKLNRELPIMSELSKANMKISPCLYEIVGDMLVIGAHNYNSMFGTINKLNAGDEVTFTDVNNEPVRYTVSCVETLNPDENDRLLSGNWDMTLFTCTYGGKQRVVVRCSMETH